MPARVIPYRSHVQHDEVDDTELGVLLLLLRELSDGTSESVSESSSLLSSSDSASCCAANFAESISTVGCANCSSVIVRHAFGFCGSGLWIWEGDSERPLATAVELIRR